MKIFFSTAQLYTSYKAFFINQVTIYVGMFMDLFCSLYFVLLVCVFVIGVVSQLSLLGIYNCPAHKHKTFIIILLDCFILSGPLYFY